MAHFPTEDWSDWQWHELLRGRRSLLLSTEQQAEAEPLVRVIDDWNQHRHLAFLTETTIGQGRLITCCADLIHHLDQRPAARQLRHSLTEYARSH